MTDCGLLSKSFSGYLLVVKQGCGNKKLVSLERQGCVVL